MSPAASPAVRPEITEPLERALAWLASLRDADGRIVCPEHRVEHSGKNAGAIVIATRLIELGVGDRDALKALAVEQGRRLVANLEREGDSPCHTFRPGWHDPYNCSNSVIDGGACSDALATLVRALGPELEAADRDAFRHASVLHARTYLRYAVLDKGVPAQRAWGLTGLAGAWALERDEVLEAAALEAVGALEAIQHPDGSYPYHPLEWGAEHPGASDVSSYYQSRVTAFLMFALETLGRDPTDGLFRRPLLASLAFVEALVGPDGRKVGLVEAKPWYWGATYEVASHPFDVFALARGARLFDRPRLAHAALRSFRAWVDHLGPDGRPSSHRPGPGRGRSYQCPVFWAGHASWLARAAEDLEAALGRAAEPARSGPGLELAIAHFPDASLVRLEDDRVVAWIRGRRPAFNVHHGSPHGAGLLRCVRKPGGEELVARCRLGGAQEAEWSGKAGGFSLARGWRSGKGALRFSTWLARTDWRAGHRLAACARPLRVFADGVLAFAAPRVGSAFELAPELEIRPDSVVVRSRLARRDGTPLSGSALERTFTVDGDGLVVTDELQAAPGVRSLEYRVPARASEVSRGAGSVRYRLG